MNLSLFPLLGTLFTLALVLLGHGTLWVAFVNHLNATGIHFRIVSTISKLAFVFFAGWPVWLLYWVTSGGYQILSQGDFRAVSPWMVFYSACCILIAIVPLPWFLWKHLPHRCLKMVHSGRSKVVDVAEQLGYKPVAGRLGRFLARVPGNQLWELEVTEKELVIPRLPKTLDGLSIAHLSDLHLTGSVTKAYFEEVVRLVNQAGPDLVAVTGDVFDDLRLKSWLPDTLGCLESRLGSYFVLGNHDHAAGENEARSALVNAGLIDLASDVRSVELDGGRMVLSGTEYPWGLFPAIAEELGIDYSRCPSTLRVLLAHTPDEYPFARRHQFDLMLAGHSHGGQIRLPWIGPVVCPIRGGIKYAAGTFYEPPTLMHVSRGISSQLPIRMNCRPELALLVLRAPAKAEQAEEASYDQELDLLEQAMALSHEVERARAAAMEELPAKEEDESQTPLAAPRSVR